LPAWERELHRAILAALAGRDYRRHIARARVYARLEESEAEDRARRDQISLADQEFVISEGRVAV